MGPAAAGIMVEALSDSPSGSHAKLADFGTIHFTKCLIDGQRLEGFSVSTSNVFLLGRSQTKTSAIGSDGMSFTVRHE